MIGSYLVSSEVIQTGLVTTILGIFTVFMILLLICFVIMLFSKIVMTLEGRNKPETVKKTEVINVKPQEEEPEPVEEENLIDDRELVAVITAAIAASMGGNVSPDKLVVRSLNRVRKSSWKSNAIYEQINTVNR